MIEVFPLVVVRASVRVAPQPTHWPAFRFLPQPGRPKSLSFVVPNHVPPPNDCDGADGNYCGDVVQ
jgi:hypothetical protein